MVLHPFGSDKTHAFSWKVLAMPRHNSTIIPPFPDHIDRNVFGQWISGFVDGEGSFTLGRTAHRGREKRWTPRAMFLIKLRADDSEVLKLIQSYFGTGLISMMSERGSSKPQTRYCINRINTLEEIIIPHFEQYPLFAKKRTDFEIWREGVKFVCGLRNGTERGRGRRKVTSTWWKKSEKDTFDQYIKLLRDNRVYRDPDSPLNGRPIPIIEPCHPTTSQGLLFE